MWRTLGQMALEERLVAVAECSYDALGDLVKVRFLAHVMYLQEEAAKSTGRDGHDHYEVRARIAMLDKLFKLAENIYLEQFKEKERNVEEVVALYLKFGLPAKASWFCAGHCAAAAPGRMRHRGAYPVRAVRVRWKPPRAAR
ncbi:hypothetical protein MRX96_048590 [Rhipicephalus microplus]